jgi:hypothetical protein
MQKALAYPCNLLPVPRVLIRQEGVMEKLRLTLFSLAMVLVASFALSCAATSSPLSGGANPTGQLQSITLSPATADGEGPVQLIATGHYNTPPYEVAPLSATWGACYQNAPTSEVSVTATGLARCAGGAAGTYSIFAFRMTNCNAVTSCGGGCTIVGTAQLICP